jgi:small subunit ribosomal protein S20
MKRTARNRTVKSAVRTHIKDVRSALSGKDPKAAKEALEEATKALDRAASKGVLPKKNAARKVSRLAKQVHKLSKPA